MSSFLTCELRDETLFLIKKTIIKKNTYNSTTQILCFTKIVSGGGDAQKEHSKSGNLRCCFLLWKRPSHLSLTSISSLVCLELSISSRDILANSSIPPSMKSFMGSFSSFTFSWGLMPPLYSSFKTQNPSLSSTLGSNLEASTSEEAVAGATVGVVAAQSHVLGRELGKHDDGGARKRTENEEDIIGRRKVVCCWEYWVFEVVIMVMAVWEKSVHFVGREDQSERGPYK